MCVDAFLFGQTSVSAPGFDADHPAYVLQLNADGPDAAGEVVGAATDKIDTDTTIG
jgi:hypothetical protein